MSLTTTVKCSISGHYTKSVGGRSIVDDIPPTEDFLLASGTGPGAADIAFSDKRTLASNTSENLDLTGTLTDSFGVVIAAVKVKAIEIHADKTNTTNLTIGGAASNGFKGPFNDITDAIVLGPDDRFVISSAVGWTVTAGTGDLLKVANATGASAGYRVKIIAASA
ncbi:hypothetical protein [uncultured Bradyrhizobium sp.]|uniref:hypothetical protein n=1 Tax=uncultured Bradyrhizobium sp. TaxID=199684 RepID=UPI0035CAA961